MHIQFYPCSNLFEKLFAINVLGHDKHYQHACKITVYATTILNVCLITKYVKEVSYSTHRQHTLYTCTDSGK